MFDVGDKAYIVSKGKQGTIIDVYTGENAGYTIEFADEDVLYDCAIEDAIEE